MTSENKKRKEIIRILEERGYDPDPVKVWKRAVAKQQQQEVCFFHFLLHSPFLVRLSDLPIHSCCSSVLYLLIGHAAVWKENGLYCWFQTLLKLFED